MKRYIFLILLFYNWQLFAQPSTEVYLFDLSFNGESYSLANPKNISSNEGYDNQPHFLPDGNSLLYAGTVDGQTDVFQYDLRNGEKTRLTQTPGSEYSPTPTPDGKGFSCIVLEKDGTQLLSKYNWNSNQAEVLIPDLVVGYHAWLSKRKVASFVLGDPNYLQWNIIGSKRSGVIQTKIGRSLHKVPGSSKLSFVDKSQGKNWRLRTWKKGRKSKVICNTLNNVEDLSWTPAGDILMGKNTQLYQMLIGEESARRLVADLSQYGLGGISRIAVSPKGNAIAIVLEE